MSRPKIYGTCRICGAHGKLSWEHVPPESCGNNVPVRVAPYLEIYDLGPDDPRPKGKVQQRGVGGYTLCEPCNTKTGHWYGNQYLTWVGEGIRILHLAGYRPTLTYLFHILPLDVIKQIAVMFFSVLNEGFQRTHPELVAFVLNPERRYLPPKYGFYAYFNYQGVIRTHGIVSKINLFGGRTSIFAEIAFPPYGYVLTIDSPPPDERLCDITFFSRYRPDEYAPVQLQLPVLPTILTLPGDYRTQSEIEVDRIKNELAAERLRQERLAKQPA